MDILNPALTKLIRKMLKLKNSKFSTAEEALDGIMKLSKCQDNFIDEVSRQLITFSRDEQINLLEQLLMDFSQAKDYLYNERVWPIEKKSGYDYFKAFVSFRSRIKVIYSAKAQLEDDLKMIQNYIDLLLYGKPVKGPAIELHLISSITVSTYYNLAHELVRLRLARLIGVENSIKWILDPYDRVRERMNVDWEYESKAGLSIDYASLDIITEDYKQKDRLDLFSLRYEEILADENTAKSAPVKWKASPMHLVELLVELHRKKYIDLPDTNILALSKGVCALFNVNPYTIRKYLTQKKDETEFIKVAGRNNEFEKLRNLPSLKERKFDNMKSATEYVD